MFTSSSDFIVSALVKEPNKAPSIILVEPQLGENIGMTARAMMNCSLYDLRIVCPRDGWPNENAIAASVDAKPIIENTKVYQKTIDAIADLELVFATTARPRDMIQRLVGPKQAALEILQSIKLNRNVGVMFGKESQGLDNNDVSLADAILNVPLNPSFCSLNLAQAVYTIGYEWFQIAEEVPSSDWESTRSAPLATKQTLIHMFEHLEKELEKTGFLRIAAKRPSMIRNLRNMLGRAQLTEQEVRTFRGVIRALTSTKPTNN